MDRETWTLTLDLLAAVDPDIDPPMAALAHLGSALLLFDQFDPQTAERLLLTVERGDF